MKLSSTEQRFVLHWGEMGSRWGVNRTVAQLHGLLYLSDKPLHAEEIAETLGVARSNVSNSLKELQSWELIHITHVLGDRRDHFEAIQDVWEMFNIVVKQRRRREIDPTLSMLRSSLIDDDEGLGKGSRKRIKEMLAFIEMLTAWHDDVDRLPQSVQKSMFKMGSKIQKFLPKKD